MTKLKMLEPASAEMPNSRQRWFIRYLVAILINLVVLNLYVEYSPHVHIDSYTLSIFAAIVLQILMRLTLLAEYRLAAYWKEKSGFVVGFMRKLTAWVVLFGSKFVILGAIDVVFRHRVVFDAPWHGIVMIIAVLFTMLAAEELFVRIYRRLA